MIWVMTALSLVVAAVLGALLLEAIGAFPRTCFAHAVAVSFVAGATAIATLGTVMVVSGVRLSLLPVYLLVAGLGISALRSRMRIPCPTIPSDALARGITAIAVFAVVAIIAASLDDRLWWDGWAIWSMKARVLWQDGALPTTFLDAANPWVFTHLDYPLAIPLIDWWSFSHAGEADPAIASLLGAIWFATLPMLLWTGLRARSAERDAATATLGLVLFWPIAFYAIGGTADIVIAVVLLGTVMELHRSLVLSDSGALPRMAIFLSLGVLSKNEGLAIAVVAAPIAAAALLKARAVRTYRVGWLLLPFLILAPWALYVEARGLRDSVATPAALAVVGERLVALGGGVAGLLSSMAWLVVPFIAATGALAAVHRRVPGIAAGWVVFAAYSCAVTAAYVLSPENIDWLITTSLSRVAGGLVPAVIFLSVAAAVSRTEASP